MIGEGRDRAAEAALRDAVIEVLGSRVLARDALAAALIERGLAHGRKDSVREQIDRALQIDPRFEDLADGVLFVPAALEGTVWTVWVDADDAAEGFVRVNPYLSPLGWWLIEDHVDLVDPAGAVLGPLETDGIWLDDRDTDVVFGPDGWLDELADGWASVAVVEGALCWSACADPPAPSRRQADALRAGFSRSLALERRLFVDTEPTELRFVTGDGPILEAIVADPDGFEGEPIAPMPVLCRAAGLEDRDGIVAEEGFDWDALRSWQDGNRMRRSYGLNSSQLEMLQAGFGALLTFADDGPDGLGADERERDAAAIFVTLVLDDTEVASAFWRECLRREVPLDVVEAFADELIGRLEGVPSAGLAWLLARCLDWSGDASSAAALLDELVAGPDAYALALIDAAALAADRGDAGRAYHLLRRAELAAADDDSGGSPTTDLADALMEEVEPFALRRPSAAVGRNDPCPCGSGRKYKACHLGREQHSLDDRCGWLYAKAKRFLETRRPDAVEELADAISEAADSLRLFDDLVDDALVIDLALHEGGGFAEFLAARDALLPDDEALLAAQWSLADRGVFEIRQIAGSRIDLYDIGRGEHVSVVNTQPSERTRVGTLLLGRPLPVGDTYRSFAGFITVPHTWVTELLDLTAARDLDGLTERVGQLFRPPRVQNTDGDDLELHTIRWRVADVDAVDAALRGAGFERDDDAPVWRLLRAAPGQGRTLVATLELAGDELVCEVNSRERAEMVRSAIAGALPDAAFADDVVTHIDDALADRGEPGEPLEAPSDPAVQAVLAAFVADYERRWIDEPVPALGGRTPRDAVRDPVGREEVGRLLDSFPIPDVSNIGTMDPRRLRAALGL